MNDWSWWEAQLRGENPEAQPGRPFAGFYLLRVRETRENDDPNRKPGDPRKKVTTRDVPIAIWQDAGNQWLCIRDDDERTLIRDVDAIDNIFSRCCRNAITREQYDEVTHGPDEGARVA